MEQIVRVPCAARIRIRRRIASFAILFAFVPCTVRAQDPFEIQVYDSETAPPGHVGLELHANYFARGTRTNEGGSLLPTDRVFHLTFEPHLGVTDWAEVGAYLQTAVRPNGSYDYAGTKLRFKARLPQKLTGDFGLALNTEISMIPAAYDQARFGAELRPIADVRVRALYLSLNPILDFDLAGDDAGRPQLEPAAKAEVVTLDDHLGVGLEYYATIGPIDAPLRPAEQVHRVFAALDLLRLLAGPLLLSANAGVGYALSGDEKWIVKSIIGADLP